MWIITGNKKLHHENYTIKYKNGIAGIQLKFKNAIAHIHLKYKEPIDKNNLNRPRTSLI